MPCITSCPAATTAGLSSATMPTGSGGASGWPVVASDTKVREIAEALGYHSPGGAVTAIRRVEASFESLNRTLRRLKGQLAND